MATAAMSVVYVLTTPIPERGGDDPTVEQVRKKISERGIECIFVGYVEHSKAFRFFVIEANDSVLINYIIEPRYAIFDENRFSSVPRPSLRILNGTEDIGGSVVSKEVTEEVVQQPKLQLKKSKRNRTPKDFGHKFQSYLIEETRDDVSDQHSYCFNVDDDPKTFNETMKPQDVDGTIEKFKARLVIHGFKQKLGIGYFDTYASVARISTIRLLMVLASIRNLIIYQMNVKKAFLNGDLDEEVYMNQPRGLIMPGNKNKVDLTKEFLSSRYCMKDIEEADVILSIRIKHEILKGYTNESWISNTKYNLSTTGWVFLLGGGAISWVSKKQTCITGSTMKSEFAALPSAGKESKWLKNLLIEISLCSKPIANIFIRCDSVATLAKAYSQMYNGKSRHLGVKHSMIRELITNRVISIDFVRSQQNLADHLTNRLARDLVIKSADGMELKFK
uniref:Zinc finger, CCHC-type n=1 Tax=Tanacetum cinerariifolium TaxID=118510 RepID=A0A6L2JYQ1_TANCI|nr:zinc finger, CCHC-type [Tanacetum cinerariifolium]